MLDQNPTLWECALPVNRAASRLIRSARVQHYRGTHGYHHQPILQFKQNEMMKPTPQAESLALSLQWHCPCNGIVLAMALSLQIRSTKRLRALPSSGSSRCLHDYCCYLAALYLAGREMSSAGSRIQFSALRGF
jgi:hypothetical protein